MYPLSTPFITYFTNLWKSDEIGLDGRDGAGQRKGPRRREAITAHLGPEGGRPVYLTQSLSRLSKPLSQCVTHRPAARSPMT